MADSATAQSFSVTLQDAEGLNKCAWDKDHITLDELKIYFPDTLGGMLEADTKRPVHGGPNGSIQLQNGKTYEVRTPVRKPKTSAPAGNGDDDVDVDVDALEESEGMTPAQKRLLLTMQLLRSSDAQNNNNYTWSNLIEKALRTMGGQRTGQEITQFIEDNFKELINGKTKTWRNSVMGCLSSNARKRWVKEQTVVDGKRRYVWNMKDDHSARGKHGSPKKQTRTLEEMYDDVASPFAAHTLTKLMRGSPVKKTKLMYEIDTDNNIIKSPTPPSQSQAPKNAGSPVPRQPVGSPGHSKPDAAAKRTSPNENQNPTASSPTTPSPSKQAPLLFLSNLATSPDANRNFAAYEIAVPGNKL